MKTTLLAVLGLVLASCSGGLPASSSNGTNEYDVVFGMKKVPENANKGRVFSPINLITGTRPAWSYVWFKEKTRNGEDYGLTAKADHEIGAEQTNVASRP